MTIVEADPDLAGLLAGADHVDVKFEQSAVDLRTFVAAAMNWRPLWVKALFGVRIVLARIIRLRDPAGSFGRPLSPQDVSFTPGERVALFTVERAVEGRYLVLSVTDTHLTGRLIIATTGTTFEVTTVVHYHHWTGPVYFNLIRPFHHLVVAGMARAGARPG